jgi:hypothetical protein
MGTVSAIFCDQFETKQSFKEEEYHSKDWCSEEMML